MILLLGRVANFKLSPGGLRAQFSMITGYVCAASLTQENGKGNREYSCSTVDTAPAHNPTGAVIMMCPTFSL